MLSLGLEKVRALAPLRSVRLGVILACVAVLIYGLVRQMTASSFRYEDADLYSYYQAALAVRHGANPFAPVAAWIATYRPGAILIASYYVYTPFFAVLLIPLTFLPYHTAFVVWGLCNIAFLPLAMFFALRAAGQQASAVLVFVLAAAGSLLSTIRTELWWGQADIFLVFLVCAALYARSRNHPLLAGILLAIACVTKPPLLLVVALLLWKREFHFAASAVAGFLIMLLVPFLWLGGQALRDQFTVWQFWSSQYVPFIDNQSPKGVLARLFTVNFYAHPLVVAPVLVNLLWLVCAAGVLILLLAVVKPEPLRQEPRSLLEVGTALLAVLLVSPLTEYIYVTIALVPLLALFMVALREQRQRSPSRFVLLGVAVAWFLLCLPLQHIEFFFWPHMGTSSPLADVYVLLAPAFLYVVAALFALHLYVLSQLEGRTVHASVRELISDSPALTASWLADLRAFVTHVPRQPTREPSPAGSAVYTPAAYTQTMESRGFQDAGASHGDGY